MKKKLLAIVAVWLVVASCSMLFHKPTPIPFVVTIEAQTLPINKTLLWDAPVVDATHGPATSYIVTQDKVQIGTPTVTQQAVTITTLGTHTFTVAGVNSFGTGAVGTLVVNVVIPGTPTNMRMQ
jgi:nitrous oxide reductase accessory protein NosL